MTGKILACYGRGIINTAHSLSIILRNREVHLMINEERAKQECTRLGDVWQALSKITADLKEKGVNVPPDVYASLRGTKALITLCKGHPKLEDLVPGDIDAHAGFCVACCGADVVARIKCELRNIEDLLVIKATHELGNDFAVKLQQRAMRAWDPLQAPLVSP
jgi:hypothetical protein